MNKIKEYGSKLWVAFLDVLGAIIQVVIGLFVIAGVALYYLGIILIPIGIVGLLCAGIGKLIGWF